MDRLTYRQIDRYVDRLTYKQIDRKKDKQLESHLVRQIGRYSAR